MDIATLQLVVQSGQVVAADQALKGLTQTAGQTEAVTNRLRGAFGATSLVTRDVDASVTRLGTGARKSALQMEMLVVSLGSIASGGAASAAGIASASRAMSYLTLSNPALFAIVTTVGLLAAGWESVRRATKEASDEENRYHDLSRVRTAARLARTEADLAAERDRRPTVTGYDRFGEAIVAGGGPRTSEIRRLTEENAALTRQLVELDTVTAHVARTEALRTAQQQAGHALGPKAGSTLGTAVDIMPDAAALERMKEFARTMALTAKAAQTFRDALQDAVTAAKGVRNALEASKAFMGSKGATRGTAMFPDWVQAGVGIAAAGGSLQSVFGLFAALPGPIGAVTGLLGTFGSSILGTGEAAAEAARQLRAARLSFVTTELQYVASIGTPAQQRRADIDAQYSAMYEQALALYGRGTTAFAFHIGQLGAVYKEQLRRLAEDLAQARRQASEDLEVRALRAQGQSAAAEAMALALQQERELAQARRDGADDAYLARLQEVQSLEAVAAAYAKQRDAAKSLQDFLNALKLGPLTPLSPMQQLAEARRQYEDVLTRAQGGDTGAAGRLSEVGRAFLEASRGVNASGMGYARDFARVQRETETLIGQYNEQAMTIQPEILNVNRAQLAVLQEGFTETIAAITGGLDDLTMQVRRLAASAALN